MDFNIISLKNIIKLLSINVYYLRLTVAHGGIIRPPPGHGTGVAWTRVTGELPYLLLVTVNRAQLT